MIYKLYLASSRVKSYTVGIGTLSVALQYNTTIILSPRPTVPTGLGPSFTKTVCFVYGGS